MNERSGLVSLLTFGLGPPVSFDLNAFLHLPTLLSSSFILVVVCQWLSMRWTGRLPHWDQLVKERERLCYWERNNGKPLVVCFVLSP